MTGFRQADPNQAFETEWAKLRVDARGALSELSDMRTGMRWAAEAAPLGLFYYQAFDSADYERFLSQYVDTSYWWAAPDFSRPGLGPHHVQRARWYGTLESLYWRETERDLQLLLHLKLPQESHEHHGAPERVLITIDVPHAEPTLSFDLQWFNKPANRLPEALWFSFVPEVPDPSRWKVCKMTTTFISPLEVVAKGNRLRHAVRGSIDYRDAEHALSIRSFDAPLVSCGQPTLLHFDEQCDLRGGWHVNLYNNTWGTNFPMWFGEDARFRFATVFGQ